MRRPPGERRHGEGVGVGEPDQIKVPWGQGLRMGCRITHYATGRRANWHPKWTSVTRPIRNQVFRVIGRDREPRSVACPGADGESRESLEPPDRQAALHRALPLQFATILPVSSVHWPIRTSLRHNTRAISSVCESPPELAPLSSSPRRLVSTSWAHPGTGFQASVQ